MIKKAFMKAMYGIQQIPNYVHSLEEPSKELFQKIGNAIQTGALKGVDAIGKASFPQAGMHQTQTAKVRP